jgi:hypothetical protein
MNSQELLELKKNKEEYKKFREKRNQYMRKYKMNPEELCFYCGKKMNKTSNVQRYHKECKKEYLREYLRQYSKKNKVDSYLRFKKNNPDYWANYFKSDKYLKKNGAKIKVVKYTNNNFKKDKECGLCKSKNRLQFHHWRYRMHVQRQDFSTLCKDCHSLMHIKATPIKQMLVEK